MSASIYVRSTTGDERIIAMAAGDVRWLDGAGEPVAAGGAALCVFATAAAVWAIIAPAAAPMTTSRGRPVMGGLLDLLEAPLTVGAATWTARADHRGPQRTIASAHSRCPVCHLDIEPGAEVFACSCGTVTDSLFCATGGAPEQRCFACGAPVEGGAEP